MMERYANNTCARYSTSSNGEIKEMISSVEKSMPIHANSAEAIFINGLCEISAS